MFYLELFLHAFLGFFILCLQVMFAASMIVLFRKRKKTSARILPNTSNECLPFISILLPAYQEDESLRAGCRRIAMFEYPREKFEVLLITETADDKTNRVVRHLAQQYEFLKHVQVPRDYLGTEHPRSKPRALSYSLSHLHPLSNIIGVLDSEDLVDPDLLHYAAYHLQEHAIVQGQIAIRNHKENPLTLMFAAEYALLDFLQLGRKLLDWMPFPRGTTYFFRREVIEKVGWSTRNLTEDLAFNVRAYASHIKIGLMDVTTWEESPNTFSEWRRQRSRWFQGVMQTIKERISLSSLNGWHRFSVVHTLIHMIFIPISVLLLFLLSQLHWIWPDAAGFIPDNLLGRLYSSLWMFNLTGLFLLLFQFILSVIFRYRSSSDLFLRILACLLLPILFLTLMPWASIRAMVREFLGHKEWEKTEHRGATVCPDCLAQTDSFK